MRCADESAGMQADKIIAFSHATLIEDLIYTGRVTEHFPAEHSKQEREAIILQTTIVSVFLLTKSLTNVGFILPAVNKVTTRAKPVTEQTTNVSLSQWHIV